MISKHGEICTKETFLKLEQQIINYVSPRAKDIYMRRVKFNKQNNGHTVYWSFWGDLQYELLKVLPIDRLSNQSKQLLQVLERKFIKGSRMYYYYSSGGGGSVNSPVSGKKLSDNLYHVKGLVEKPAVGMALSNLAVLGRYVLTPDVFEKLENTKPGAGNEIQLTDALADMETDIYALAYEGIRYDTGDRLGFLKATVEYALRNELIGEEFGKYLAELDIESVKSRLKINK